ncbi:2-dehydropantoate 2-reductase [Betaproteobacteria bacterium GR16-43]|nr:2-dehydropantoate 2-reductase [Betaproteobacteria bacterium GR16-43]
MKFCIVGAGAIGGFVAARLAGAGHEVALVARGPHLAALKRDGITVLEADGTRHTHRVAAHGHVSEAGPADVVLLTLKAMQLGPMAADLPNLFHDGTVVVPMQNGVPWWYFQRHGGEHEGLSLASVDPSGALAAAIPAERIVGCVVYPASEIASPGVIRHVEGERLPLGELDGTVTPRVEAISRAFQDGGLKAPVLTDIRSEIWLKLWGNLTFNPLSALTRATLDRICAEPLTRELAAAMMTEAALVAGRLGISFRVPIERRIEGASKVRGHKTSMLQDIEAGRPTELDPLLGSVIELARLTGSDVPNIRAVYACTRLLEATVRQ